MNAPIHLMTSMLIPELFLFNFMRYSLLFLGHRIRPISFWKSRRQLWCPGNEIKQSQREGNQLIYDWIKLRKSLYFTVKTLSLQYKENTVQCNLWGWRAYMKIFIRTLLLTDWRVKFLAMSSLLHNCGLHILCFAFFNCFKISDQAQIDFSFDVV